MRYTQGVFICLVFDEFKLTMSQPNAMTAVIAGSRSDGKLLNSDSKPKRNCRSNYLNCCTHKRVKFLSTYMSHTCKCFKCGLKKAIKVPFQFGIAIVLFGSNREFHLVTKCATLSGFEIQTRRFLVACCFCHEELKLCPLFSCITPIYVPIL
ncbi:hypothetical protein L7F22_004582 [Adiantum nelumboides]|nr:hypothetical protein [Adiantum nelumboides]